MHDLQVCLTVSSLHVHSIDCCLGSAGKSVVKRSRLVGAVRVLAGNAMDMRINPGAYRPYQTNHHHRRTSPMRSASRSQQTRSQSLRLQNQRSTPPTTRSTHYYQNYDSSQTTTSIASTSSGQGLVRSLLHISTVACGGRTSYEHVSNIPPLPPLLQRSVLSIEDSNLESRAKHSSIVISRTSCTKRLCESCPMI